MIGQLIDDAMVGVERDNPALQGVLPKDYARPALDKTRLGQLVDLVSNIRVGDEASRAKDVLGRVYEYFLAQFASAEGKKGGQFYTPRCVVNWVTGTAADRLSLLRPAQERFLSQADGKDRYGRVVRDLSKAFALAVPQEDALRIRDDVAFFQAVQAVLVKRARGDARPEKELDHAVRQIISGAVAPEGVVVDIFAAAGLEKPDILDPVRRVPGRGSRDAAPQPGGRAPAEAAQGRIAHPQPPERGARTVLRRDAGADTAPLPEPRHRGGAGDRAADWAGQGHARGIARELVATVGANVTIDWTVRENVRAHLRVLVKRILRKHGYPPDKQERATQAVLEQTELLSSGWAA